ncbi:hypothetical protein [Emticicia sp. BO119]|uniref:hypothetical protein n=1 Tax=Emticicia sp. BO119 TaxID=2757768 RepID=UPI0015F085F8|nr:hypothetical protein [Emticicia sp. BO119]MBA4849029.1 hypothetical protein [Emticicia sp. BO119]
MNNANTHTHNDAFSFWGGVFFTIAQILKQLFETTHMTFSDIIKAIVVGMIGAVSSGFGAWLFKTYLKRWLDKLVKKS